MRGAKDVKEIEDLSRAKGASDVRVGKGRQMSEMAAEIPARWGGGCGPATASPGRRCVDFAKAPPYIAL